MTWSGAVSGTTPCKGTTWSKFLGVKTAATVTWMVTGEAQDPFATFSFHLAKPIAAMTYNGTSMPEQACTAGLTQRMPLSVWNASSRPLSSGMTPGNCSMTITSVSDQTSGSTSTFVVHGKATATLAKTADMSTVELTVTF
jgi:hypothetical protein